MISDPQATSSPPPTQIERAAGANKHFHKYLRRAGTKRQLLDIVDASFDKLGFFTSHPPRAFEYPWVLANIPRRGGVVVDLGAGLSPLPFILADRGNQVVTVDYSNLVRTADDRKNWSEWGFLDYSSLRPGIISHNIDFGLLDMPAGSVSCVYSVSVVEHMPAAIRRRVVSKAAELLKPSGSLVLTLDLVPKTLKLWNLDRRKEVEPPAQHGTVLDFIQELDARGLKLKGLGIERGLPGSATDICCLTAVRA